MQLAVYRSHDKLFPSISLSMFSFLESWGWNTYQDSQQPGVNRFFDFRFSGSTETARAHVTFIDFLVTKCTVGTTYIYFGVGNSRAHYSCTNIQCMQTLHSCTKFSTSRSTANKFSPLVTSTSTRVAQL
jgi:hypothetical protein